ncbi:NAD(P)-binding domain-containing protein [Herbiconiux sp. CPCC 205716]|uniref:NAD(P)-binding domain-containing protein n=1 Tax=Herbiconiux gentiana TaxID=2970912 RepID=A0ABT2GH28_9MICO|nr:NAD(P)-binding domain-containing protein [Herbiconiux gentiana]MCS5714585.1 NAD(P)-binding domain-containing protein [Herbiconiux gentiana]
MKIAVLGTGMVGRALAGRLAELGHDVSVGTRDVADTRRSADYPAWQKQHPAIALRTFREASEASELILNAVAGAHALPALETVGAAALSGKVLLDLAIPLDLSAGLPPTLTTANTDSLGERIQAAFPDTFVVKSLHTVYYEVMIDPARVPGEHSIFVAGNDPSAKDVVIGILEQFGWPARSIIDLGDITAARATEMYSRLFFALYNRLGTFDFNITVVRAGA